MKKLGEVLVEFFRLRSPSQFYYPGIGRGVHMGYESEFRSMAASMENAGLEVHRMGITLSTVYSDEKGPCFRGNDFHEICIADVCKMEFDGLLFLPDLGSWPCTDSPDRDAVRDGLDYLSRAREGVLFFSLGRTLRPGQVLEFEKVMLERAGYDNYLEINWKGTKTIAVRNDG